MEKLRNITIIFLLAVGLLSSAIQAKPASVLLQEGLYAEEIEGDLDAAIQIYEQIIAKAGADERSVAQAMYRLGMCHLKRQNEQQAKVTFEKLVAQFPEQTSIISKVQPLLDEMSNPDPATIMPPDTKIYLEFGSPGKQFETILNMLKGTPFENPLAAIGGNAGQKSPGDLSPGDVMAALLNPSMMAEFKKIRGMAIGVLGLGNNPPLIVVLFPGKSDALRGILLAALGMAGKPGEPIGDMQVLQISDTVGAAYDDNVIIIAQPLEQLTWCAKQYKDITQEPTLVSQNKLFAKLSRKSREENTLTIWLDGAATFAAISEQMAKSGQADKLRLIDGIADFESFEEVIMQLSIQENNIALEVNVGFKDGSNCLIYDLIRTPNLSRDSFEVVPAQAVAVASFALGESENIRVEAAQKAVTKLTGLDIGREIFANIEQVALFALPPSPASDESIPAAAKANVISSLGLAVTSRNPQKTHRLLTQLLTVADLIANSSTNEKSGRQANAADGKYKITMVNNQQIYCYIDQVGKNTILTLSPEVLQACLSALKNRQSVLTAGPLQKPLSSLRPDTSKLVLVNVGGAIRIANAHLNWVFENPDNPVHQLLAQLAQACDNTSIELRTGEKLNSFNLHLSINKLPPLDAVSPLLMQLSQVNARAKVKATGPEPADKAVTGTAGTKVKLSWIPGANATKHKVYFGSKPEKLSLLAEVASPGYAKLPALEKDKKYYWRVDEVQADGSVVAGKVWSFNTMGKLIGWWKFDESSGSTAADSSGNNHHGTLGAPNNDPQWVAGTINGALYFDGDLDYVDCGTFNPSEGTGEFTFAFWVRWDGIDNKAHALIAKRNSWSDSGMMWQFSIYPAGSTNLAMLSPASGANASFGNNMNIPQGEWAHLAVTYDGTDATLYINGLKRKTRAFTMNSATDARVVIGAATGSVGQNVGAESFNGKLDDVRIYNYTLSEAEVAAIYKGTRSAFAEEAVPEKAEAEPKDK